ncbi:YhbC family protein [Actinomyces denticolens]|nr:YhbC family protein [Actinomyces denticolens]
MTDTLASRLTDLLAPVVEAEGLFLEGIETTRAGRHSAVRVIVDLPDGPGDLDLDRIGEATAALSAALDDADPVKGQYTLEVSTPGAERELRSPGTSAAPSATAPPSPPSATRARTPSP